MRYLSLLVLLAACTDQGPFVPAGAIPWNPPSALVDSLWAATETCSGLEGDSRPIQWYIVPVARFDTPLGEAMGMWDGDRSIYLAEPNYPTHQPWPFVVQHEMLHALLHSGAHPAVFDTCHLR